MTGFARTARELAGAAAVLLAIASCSPVPTGFEVEDASQTTVFDFDYLIPSGAGRAIDEGEPLEILPAEIAATVGQSIRIVNDDDRGHLVGIWFVGAGETLTQTFTSAGELSGECSVHPSGQIRVVVSA